MVMRMGKKIVCIKDLPSNLIEEAIFILKSDVMEDSKHEARTKEILLSEAEDIVAEYVLKVENEEAPSDAINISQISKEIIYIAGLLVILGICILKVI